MMPAPDPATLPSLSPSRANDFKSCPLKYRYRVIDRIPEPPSAAAARGTLVHAVLDALFDRPAAARTEEVAVEPLPQLWADLVRRRPELAELDEASDPDLWFAAARELVHRYFDLEDPRRFDPAERELRVEVELEGGVPTRGFIDRVDISPTGLVRIVDYKTGRAPSARFAGDALFQLKFYALMLYRIRGVVASRLRLIYLGDGQIVEYDPDEAGLQAFEQTVGDLWRTMQQAAATGSFRPRRSRLCDWCSFQHLCPEFGGTPPPMPGSVRAGTEDGRRRRAAGIRPDDGAAGE